MKFTDVAGKRNKIGKCIAHKSIAQGQEGGGGGSLEMVSNNFAYNMKII